MERPSGPFARFLQSTALVISLVLVAAAGVSALADDKPTVDNKSEGNALRASVTNAIVNYVNNAREVSLDIKWDLLPETNELFIMSASTPAVRLTVRNTDLSSIAAWTSRVTNKEARAALAHVLGLPEGQDLSKFDPMAPGDAYESALNANANFLSSDEVITGLFDHYFLRFILSTSGIGTTIRSTDAVIQGGDRRLDREIRWKIALYPVRTVNRFTLYRVSLCSELDRPETLVFPGTTQSTATLQVAAAFKPSPNTIGVRQRFSFQSQGVNIPQSTGTPLAGDDTKLGGTAVEGVLKFIGGVDLSDVVAHNLLSGTSKASIYYGGLVGQGKVQQLVGVNQVFGRQSGDIAAGLLMGIAPGSNNSLFIGPSFRSDTITASIGGIALQKPNGTGSDTKVGIYPAATLALDLSRLVGGKKDTQTIKLDRSVIGGPGPDALAKQVYGVHVVINGQGLQAADLDALRAGNSYLQWKRVKKYSTDGTTLTDTSGTEQTIFRTLIPSEGMHFVPRGEYQLDDIKVPDGYEVVTQIGTPYDRTKLVGIGRSGQSNRVEVSLQVRKKQ